MDINIDVLSEAYMHFRREIRTKGPCIASCSARGVWAYLDLLSILNRAYIDTALKIDRTILGQMQSFVP